MIPDEQADPVVATFAIRYSVNVYVTVPCDEEGYPSYTARELERAIIHHLKKLDGDVDCEVMESEPVRADGTRIA